ncbi:MAG: hypothetical protein NTX97_03015 [Bacteroidetes bacterium]|nr:hypothetical protein [Bacteroidota bacterium]
MSFRLKFIYSWNRLRFYLSFLLLAFYLIVGSFFLFGNTWKELLPKGRETVGLVLILFGAFRFYIAYRRYKNKLTRIEIAIKSKEAAIVE